MRYHADMRRLIIGLLTVWILLLPVGVFADTEPLTRRDGFLIIWEGIQRAVLENREKPFADVPQDAKGFTEITYAKYRGILDDDSESFAPDQPLMIRDALLWLYRTRSVDDIKNLTLENLPTYVTRYHPGMDIQQENAATQEQLIGLLWSLDSFLAKEEHEVSLYSEKFHGKGTAFGETFDMHAMTAAHRTFPHNTLVRVTNVRNGKEVIVRINDRGPFVDGRDMDLSLGAFTSIEDRSKGILRATFQRLGDATIVDVCGDTDTRRVVRLTKDVHFIGGIPSRLPLGQSFLFRSTQSFVVHSVLYPDGNSAVIQDWILPGESHAFTPSMEGTYTFLVRSKEGHGRKIAVEVRMCKK